MAGIADDAQCRLCMVQVGTLQHRSVECMCHDDLRRHYAPRDVVECRGDALNARDDMHWLTRALQPTKAYLVPPPHPEATFVWVVCPEGGASMLTGPSTRTALDWMALPRS